MLVGLIPAAGHATRLGLRFGSKETLAVRGRPVMDHLVERLIAADVDVIRVVTRPKKRDVVEHAHRLGADVVLGHPPDVSASLRLGAAGLDGADEVVFGFPDTVWEPVDGFVALLAALRTGAQAALGLFRTPDAARSDVVVLGEDGRVADVEVKPPVPRSDLVWGCAATHATTLRRIGEGQEPGAWFAELAQAGGVVGVWLSNRWIDIGTPDALHSVTRSDETGGSR